MILYAAHRIAGRSVDIVPVGPSGSGIMCGFRHALVDERGVLIHRTAKGERVHVRMEGHRPCSGSTLIYFFAHHVAVMCAYHVWPGRRCLMCAVCLLTLTCHSRTCLPVREGRDAVGRRLSLSREAPSGVVGGYKKNTYPSLSRNDTSRGVSRKHPTKNLEPTLATPDLEHVCEHTPALYMRPTLGAPFRTFACIMRVSEYRASIVPTIQSWPVGQLCSVHHKTAMPKQCGDDDGL